MHSLSSFHPHVTDAFDIRDVAVPVPQLSLGHPNGTQPTHDAHSDPGHRNTNGTRVASPAGPVPQDVQRRMSHTSHGGHEKSDWEKVPADEHKARSGHENVPDVAREQVSQKSSSETSHVHPKSLGSAASSRSRRGRSMLWENLRDKHGEVLRYRVSLRESRTALGARQRAIDDAEAQLLPAMTAALTDFSIPTLKDVVAGFQALQTSRQSLRLDREAHEQLEQQLIADEEVLVDLETNAYAELSSPTEFPGGFLDFTRDHDPDTASIASIPIEAPPAKKEYDRRLRRVNVIRERLLDMQSENEQLLREQEQRRRLGRTLDAFSIQILHEFKDRFESMTLELDRAQVEFELAEATWTSRRKTIEREDNDSEAMQPVALEEPSSIPLDEFYSLYEDIHENLDSLVEENEHASAIAQTLFQPENDSHPGYELPSEAENGEHINQARFISQWLLQRIQQSPAETRQFAKQLAERFPSRDAQELVDAALSCWIQDGMEEDFIDNVKEGEDSKAPKLSPTSSGRLGQINTDSS